MSANPAQESKWALEPGVELGSWRITAPIGVGGMGEVYEASHRWLPTRTAAIKVMRRQRRAHGDFAARFRAEAALLATIDHPNVVRLYDAGVTDEGLAWMAMERLRGRPLDEILTQRGRIAAPEALQILAETADGVHAAHVLGIVHRDLKPSNVFIADDGAVKVLDFGTSKLLGAAHVLRGIKPTTAHDVVIGTFAFMSPEQLLGKPPLDHRSDIFALGLMAYLMLSGTHPFAGQDGVAPEVLAYRALIVEPDALGQRLAGLPAELVALVHAMLEKNREARPHSLAPVIEQLRLIRQRLLDQERAALTPAPAPAPAPQPTTIDPKIRALRDLDATHRVAPAPAPALQPTTIDPKIRALRDLDATQRVAVIRPAAAAPAPMPAPAATATAIATPTPTSSSTATAPAAVPAPVAAAAPIAPRPSWSQHRQAADASAVQRAAGTSPAPRGDPTLRAREEALTRRRARRSAETAARERAAAELRERWHRTRGLRARAYLRRHRRQLLGAAAALLALALALAVLLWRSCAASASVAQAVTTDGGRASADPSPT